MRIAIVAGTYRVGFSFQENLWAEWLARWGHRVRVIAADRHGGEVREVGPDDARVEFQPIRSWIGPRLIRRTRGDVAALREFAPELIFWLPESHFGIRFARAAEFAHVPVITFFGLHYGFHEYDWKKRGIGWRQWMQALGYAVLRGGVVRTALRRSALIVANVPISREIVLLRIPRAERATIDAKIIDLFLGCDPLVFRYDRELREYRRQELGIAPETILGVFSSRFEADKRPLIEQTRQAIDRALTADSRLHMLIVGTTDNAISRQFRAAVETGPHRGRIHLQPFADRAGLNGWYNAADFAVFPRASISCQEALGTGAIGIFDDSGTLHHLVRDPRQAVFFPARASVDPSVDPGAIAAAIAKAAQTLGEFDVAGREQFRQQMATTSRWLGYDRLLEQLGEILRQRQIIAADAPLCPPDHPRA